MLMLLLIALFAFLSLKLLGSPAKYSQLILFILALTAAFFLILLMFVPIGWLLVGLFFLIDRGWEKVKKHYEKQKISESILEK